MVKFNLRVAITLSDDHSSAYCSLKNKTHKIGAQHVLADNTITDLTADEVKTACRYMLSEDRIDSLIVLSLRGIETSCCGNGGTYVFVKMSDDKKGE